MAEEDLMQQLRSKATYLLLREEWTSSIQAYTHFINLCHQNSKPLCLALSSRAEARFRLKDYTHALTDCDEALKIDTTHHKTLVLKGKILLNLNRYSSALTCFKAANNGSSSVEVNEYLKRCKRLELMSKNGGYDVSEWVLGGFKARPPEAAEYIGW